MTRTFDIDLSPEELAKEFSQMDSLKQALFFNYVFLSFKDEAELNQQMSDISFSPLLNNDGRKVMKIIGEFSEIKKITSYKNWTIEMVKDLDAWKSNKNICPEEVLAYLKENGLPFGDITKEEVENAIFMLTPF